MPQLKPGRSTKHLGAGLTLAAAVGLFAYGGHLLDQKTGLEPLFLLIGVLLGSVGGFIHVVATVAPEMLPGRRRKAADAARTPPASTGSAAAEPVDRATEDEPPPASP